MGVRWAGRSHIGCFYIHVYGVLVIPSHSLQLTQEEKSREGAIRSAVGEVVLISSDAWSSKATDESTFDRYVRLAPSDSTARVRTMVNDLPTELFTRILDPPQSNSKGPLNALKVLSSISPAALFVPTLLGFSILALIGVSLAGGFEPEDTSAAVLPDGRSDLKDWSLCGLAALQSYRFYAGFLSATWMPYLLAMEGQELAGEQQSFFMGCAKLIYGMSILFNPVFGLMSDNMVTVSHWSGRRVFIILGVGMSGLGIYGCMVASDMKVARWYFVGTILWMVGEALADVTTETFVPEMLPRGQFQIASSIRSLLFLLGGLSGHVMLIIYRHETWSWLYYGYLVVMLACALLTLISLNHGRRDVKPRRGHDIRVASLQEMLHQAYVAPTLLDGGFPRACLCIFVYSFGSAPMFFLLLMIRDLGGVREPSMLQMHFALISIVFFLSASLSSAVLGASDLPNEWVSSEEDADAEAQCVNSEADIRRIASSTGGLRVGAEDAEPGPLKFASRWSMMIIAILAVGATNLLAPMIWIFPTVSLRIMAFYVYSVGFGLAFGCAMSKFQECTWYLLEPGMDVANAMGFATMCKLAGVGFGNFAAGVLLNCYYKGGNEIDFIGYLSMCSFCALVLFLSAFGVFGVAQQATALQELRRN